MHDAQHPDSPPIVVAVVVVVVVEAAELSVGVLWCNRSETGHKIIKFRIVWW